MRVFKRSRRDRASSGNSSARAARYSQRSKRRRAAGADDGVHRVERGIGLREVGAHVRAAALVARERAGRDQARERVGVVEQPLEALARAPQAGVAPERLARRCADAPRHRRHALRRALRARGLAAGGERARGAPKTKHSLSEFDARRLAPCRPVQADSPTA